MVRVQEFKKRKSLRPDEDKGLLVAMRGLEPRT